MSSKKVHWHPQGFIPSDDMTVESAMRILDEVQRGVFTGYRTSKVYIRNPISALACACLVLFDSILGTEQCDVAISEEQERPS